MRPSRPAVAALLLAALAACAACAGAEPREVSFATADGGMIVARLYGAGDRAVVLAHGAVFDKESWDPLARHLEAAGLRVLALDFRGYGRSRPGSEPGALELDVLAAIDYLAAQGAGRVSVVGASMGGGAAARAATLARPGAIDRLILLAPVAIANPEAMHAGRLVFVASRDEPARARVEEQYRRSPEPRRLVLLEGSAHAQHVFATARGDELTRLLTTLLTDEAPLPPAGAGEPGGGADQGNRM